MAISLVASILDLVKIILEPIASHVARKVRRVWRLSKTADTLAAEMAELLIIQADMENAVAVHTAHRTQPTNEVRNWLEKVDSLRAKVELFQEAFQNSRSCLAGGCHSCWSRYKLSKAAESNLEQARQLRSQRTGIGAQMVGKVPPPEVEMLPGSSAPVVGGAATLSELRRHLSSYAVGVVGIYGMGGIGKTTLLAKLNEELRLNQGENDFNLVIWVTVSRDSNIMKIQEDVGVRLNYCRTGEDGGQPLPPNESDRAKILLDALSKKKFLLLLDDLWDTLDLDRVGIPSCLDSRNGSTVVFTTRSEDVCARMSAQEKVKVSFLNETQSWELFTESCDHGTLFDDPSIRELAEKIVAKCGGLPLALVTVGRAMATSRTRPEWKRALRMLKDAPERLQGMEQVLPLLKFSYDRLENDVTRSCLLYCCLFPEDQSISKEQLVEYWVGEGLLDGGDGRHVVGSITHAREEGYHVIGRLQAACLLEAGVEDESEVRMHDAIREMAFWIAGVEFLPNAGLGLMEPPSPERWSAATRISLMWNQIEELPRQIPECPNLSTLLINSTYRIQQLPDGFLDAMPRLRVLDLSGSSLQHLPPAVGLLSELRYLNLANTAVASLPREIGNLINLRQLDLMYTFNLHEVPCNAISELKGLQALNIFGSVYSWDSEESDDEETKASIRDLESLERLKELGITIRSLPPLERILGSNRLSKSIRFLSLEGIEDLTSNHLSKIFSRMKKLRKLEVTYCPQLAEIVFSKGQLDRLEYLLVDEVPRAEFLIEPRACGSPLGSLRRLVIGDCHELTDLSWVAHLTYLENIELYLCQEMEELVRSAEETVTTEQKTVITVEDCCFPKLKGMHLRGLTKLRRISQRPLLLPSLETLFVNGCPELKQLPFGPSSSCRMKRIVGKQEWWGGLEWLQDDIKARFSRCFLDLDRQLWEG